MGEGLEQLVWLELDTEPAQLSFQDFATVGDVLFAFLTAEPAPDLLASGGGRYIFGGGQEPVAIWPTLRAAGQDSDDLPVLQLVVERNELVVDLGADALVADFRMDTVGEVDRCSPAGSSMMSPAGVKT